VGRIPQTNDEEEEPPAGEGHTLTGADAVGQHAFHWNMIYYNKVISCVLPSNYYYYCMLFYLFILFILFIYLFYLNR